MFPLCFDRTPTPAGANNLIDLITDSPRAPVLNGELLTAKDRLNLPPDAIQLLLAPKAPPQNSLAGTIGIENGTWEVDWTMHGDDILANIPQGVNTVNLFVSGFDSKNNYQIDTRSDLDLVIPPTSRFYDPKNPQKTYLQKYVEECHAQGIAVKMSLGGSSAGWCGNCWDALKSQGAAQCAATLLAFCQKNGLDGIDFDFEEWDQSDQKALEQSVGELIKIVKSQNPSLQTSLCTNAGFSTWQNHVQNILDASKNEAGKCGVDRIYIMSYYDPLSSEEAWVGQWAKWLETNYQFSPSQISVGLDNVDANAYDLTQFAQWAKSQGYSTCYWAWGWDGGYPGKSNDTTKKIWDIYHNNV